MKRTKLLFLGFLGVIMGLSLFGCTKPKYKLNFDGHGFESKKEKYAEGETVTVYFDLIATDTDYHFWLDDETVALKQDYDGRRGYVFRFTMPDHDVTLHMDSHNSMEYHAVYDIEILNKVETADFWILPQTEANLKTTVWGTATVAKLSKGESEELSLQESPLADLWMIRIIDVQHALYSVNDIVFSEGYRIVFRTPGRNTEAVIEVLDAEGNIVLSKPAFTGVLGGQ